MSENLAMLGSGVLTFLAGAKIDPRSLRAHLRASLSIGVWPLSRYFFMRSREAKYTALRMSNGLTFATILALFGLQNKIIAQNQYSVLVTVVIPSAFIADLAVGTGAGQIKTA